MKGAKTLGILGIVMGTILWYIITIIFVLCIYPIIDHVFGIGSVVIKGWLSLGSLLILIFTGLYVVDCNNRVNIKRVLKWLICGVTLWGLAITPLVTMISAQRLTLCPDDAYRISLLIGCLIIFSILILINRYNTEKPKNLKT